MIEFIALPLIGFVLALFGVFFDAKRNPRSVGTIALVTLLLLTSAYSGWSAWDKNKRSEEETRQAIADKNVLRDTLFNVSKKVGEVGSGVDAISEYFGIKTDNRSASVVAKSIQANEALARLTTATSAQANQKITVQFFPKEIDREVVQSTLVASLSQAGFTIKSGIGNPSLGQVPTNAVWYGPGVPDDSIRTVALALTRAGVKLRAIQPFSEAKPAMTNLIQIGSYSAAQDKPVYGVDQISSMPIPR